MYNSVCCKPECMPREDRILHYSHGSEVTVDYDEPENKELKFNCRATERALYTLNNLPIPYTPGKVHYCI